ncbi:Leucine-rich repeat-containing protein 20, partial [Eschrichtius robustus]|nr:Leucine-rich repeat-containing protein 20 [Eschrichtius robustus]
MQESSKMMLCDFSCDVSLCSRSSQRTFQGSQGTDPELHLEGNFLQDLPNEVSTLRHLKAIDLSRNQFHDFPEQLTTLPALETINLEENEIV